MSLTPKELWTVLHGMVFGAIFLLAFTGGLVGLWSLRPGLVTIEGIRERLPRLNLVTWGMASVAWITVITGTYIVYPWYRAKPPEGGPDLSQFPRYMLLADETRKLWHTFGMEWKEHIGWVAPILATAVAFLVTYYGAQLAHEDKIRRAAMILFAVAFGAAAIAGVLGAFLNKVAPIQ